MEKENFTNPRREFRAEVSSWLKPAGFKEVYSINHPTDNKDEVHFSKSGIRICCIFEYNRKQSYWYVYCDCFLKPEMLSLRSGKYGFDSKFEMTRVFSYVDECRNQLEG